MRQVFFEYLNICAFPVFDVFNIFSSFSLLDRLNLRNFQDKLTFKNEFTSSFVDLIDEIGMF